MLSDSRSRPDSFQPEFHGASRLDEMIVRAVNQLNGRGRRPLATPRLVSELLGPHCRRNPGPVNPPILDEETFAFLHPDEVRDRIARLLRDRFLRATRTGRIYLPENTGPLH